MRKIRTFVRSLIESSHDLYNPLIEGLVALTGSDADYHIDVTEDSFIHFTTDTRAKKIIEGGVLSLETESHGYGPVGVYAVSTTFGQQVPSVQLYVKNFSDDPVVAIHFKTNTIPKVGFPEEVIWKEDVKLIDPKVIDADKAMASLKPRDDEDYVVTYRSNDVITESQSDVHDYPLSIKRDDFMDIYGYLSNELELDDEFDPEMLQLDQRTIDIKSLREFPQLVSAYDNSGDLKRINKIRSELDSTYPVYLYNGELIAGVHRAIAYYLDGVDGVIAYDVSYVGSDDGLFESSNPNKMIGYKVMAITDGKLVSGRDSRITHPLQVGPLSMPGNGVYIGTNKDYVMDYYSELADDEVLLTVEFDPADIKTGSLDDNQDEISIPTVNVINIQKINDGALIESINSTNGRLTLYHGTLAKQVESIKSNGITSPQYHDAGWYTLSSNIEGAIFHAQSDDEYAPVIEVSIPIDPESMWEGHPYLWPGAEVSGGEWYALMQKIPPEFIVKVHDIPHSEFDSIKSSGF
jgi:hypothetical protein